MQVYVRAHDEGQEATPAKSVMRAADTKSKLLFAMTGKASAAKAAEGDAPVFAYIATMPQPQRSIAERIDSLAVRTLPGVQRAVKWGMAYYGLGGGWCFSSGAFVGHVKLMFIHGSTMKPEPPVKPTGMGKATRGVELASLADLDEQQVTAWMTQAAATPFFTAATKKTAAKKSAAKKSAAKKSAAKKSAAKKRR